VLGIEFWRFGGCSMKKEIRMEDRIDWEGR